MKKMVTLVAHCLRFGMVGSAAAQTGGAARSREEDGEEG